MKKTNEQSEERRKILRETLEEHGLTATDIARRNGWKNPNKIYNFLNDQSDSLSTDTYEQIASAMPGVTVQDLLGQPKRTSAREAKIKLTTACQAGTFRDFFSISEGETIALPINQEKIAAGAFGASVIWPGGDLIYREHSILVCVPFAKSRVQLKAGRHLVVQKFVDKKMEITIREVISDKTGRLWLSHKSDDPRFSGAVQLPKAIGPKPWVSNGERYAIAAVVVGSYQPES